MKITYAIWQGSTLLSINNIATNVKQMDAIITELNTSDTAKSIKYSANVQKIEVK